MRTATHPAHGTLCCRYGSPGSGSPGLTSRSSRGSLRLSGPPRAFAHAVTDADRRSQHGAEEAPASPTSAHRLPLSSKPEPGDNHHIYRRPDDSWPTAQYPSRLGAWLGPVAHQRRCRCCRLTEKPRASIMNSPSRKELAAALRRHVEKAPERIGQVAGAVVLVGGGRREAHLDPQKCPILPSFFLKTLKIVSSQFSPSGTRCCARMPLENFDVSPK